MKNELTIKNGTKIAVIGAGPAGSFFTVSLLVESRLRNIHLDVTLFDSKDFKKKGPRGCNMCAGVLGRIITSRLDPLGINVEPIIQREIRGYNIHTSDSLIPLDFVSKESAARIFTVYRGSGPSSEASQVKSFDQFLLEKALSEGAHLVEKRVQRIVLPESPESKVVVGWDDGEDTFDVVVGAFGVNSNLLQYFKKLDFGYVPPEIWNTCQAEIKIDPDYITNTVLDYENVFVLGFKNVKVVTFTPKHDYLTVTAVGKQVRKEDLLEILKAPRIKEFLSKDYEISCSCHPRLPVSSPVKPFTDRLVIIGDASYCKYLKNGIESAFLTSSLAVKTLLTEGFSEEAFRRIYYRKCEELFSLDNLFGKFIITCADSISKVPLLVRTHAKAVHRELAEQKSEIASILWDLTTGEISYKNILKRCLSLDLHRRHLVEFLKIIWRRDF